LKSIYIIYNAPMTQPIKIDPVTKLEKLRLDLITYEAKLKFKMKGYRGIIHESASSELKHSEVMVLTDMVQSLQKEIDGLEKDLGTK